MHWTTMVMTIKPRELRLTWVVDPMTASCSTTLLKFVQPVNSTMAYTTINVNFADIFEGCSQERFINLTQMDAQIYPTNDDA